MYELKIVEKDSAFPSTVLVGSQIDACLLLGDVEQKGIRIDEIQLTDVSDGTIVTYENVGALSHFAYIVPMELKSF